MFLRKLRKKKKQDVSGGEIGLQITSLADILIVVLVFLLKSFSSGISTVENITVPKNIHLPEIETSTGGKDGIRIEISNTGISIDGQPLAKLENFRFPAEDLNGGSRESNTSKTLLKGFAHRKEEDANAVKSVWVVADRLSPYQTVQTVLASAAAEGYSDFKLAVIKGD